MNIGEKIAHYRKLKNISQRELGRRIGITGQAISKIELGNSLPSISTLKDISKELDISIVSLVDNEEQKIELAALGIIEEVHKDYKNKIIDLENKILELESENKMLKDLVKFQSEKITKLEGEING